MSLEIIEVQNKKNLKKFIRFSHQVYKKDPNWVPPLEFERIDFFNPKKNPFYKQGEAALFLAIRNGQPVGRISAQIHHGHLERYKDQAGFFGFFESIEDQAVANALLEKSREWVKQRGMKKLRGPFHFTMYDNEAGFLIDGYDTPPVIMMNHNPPYYPRLLEAEGFHKIMDTFAWKFDVTKGIPEPALQLAEATEQYPGLKLRTVNMKRFDEEVRLMMNIFNEAWAENWGFVPATEKEIGYIAKMLKPIIDPEMVFFAHVNGDPAAFSVLLPNIHEAIRDLKGKLFPFGWAKLLWRLKRGLKSGRLCLMGIRKPYRGSKLGALSVLMNVEMNRRGQKRGYKMAELGWTLETNERINRGIEFMGGRKYKTYRIYEKEL